MRGLSSPSLTTTQVAEYHCSPPYWKYYYQRYWPYFWNPSIKFRVFVHHLWWFIQLHCHSLFWQKRKSTLERASHFDITNLHIYMTSRHCRNIVTSKVEVKIRGHGLSWSQWNYWKCLYHMIFRFTFPTLVIEPCEIGGATHVDYGRYQRADI